MRSDAFAGNALPEWDRKIGTFLLYGYLIFEYVRPQEIAPAFAAIPIAGAFIYGCAVWGLFHIRSSTLRSPLGLILLFAIVCGISAIDAVNLLAYKIAIQYFFPTLPLCASIYILIDSPERIFRFVNFWIFLYFLIAVVTIINGGLGPGDFIKDPNDTSLALNMGLPFIVYSAFRPDISRARKLVLSVVAVVVVFAIIYTQSRGGFVGLASVLFGFWFLSRKKIRLALISIVGALALSGGILSVLPEGYVDEIMSISDREESTRVERLWTWEMAWIMYKDNPVFGVGAGQFAFNAGTYQRMTSWWTGVEKSLHGRVTHSVYFQILSELGTAGAIVFGYVMFYLPLRLYSKFRRCNLKEEECPIYIKYYQMLMVSMAAFLSSGAFISVAYYPHLPIWITLFAIFLRFERQRNKSLESLSLT
ncbi:O-antigen ligase family protein [Lentisalinibacter sediminis]|uniref:O-antigen ligase family protein n=1 Tax=Lentisalinibacter sediminis TaxID=2992237 RepID=UPI003866A4DE